MVDRALVERSKSAHGALTNLVAARLRAVGCVPRSNGYVDLAALVGRVPHLFEMKSTTAGNVHTQIRTGLSQLYEYRYLQGVPSARLVLVLQHPVPRDLGWMLQYLITDRQVLVAWDGCGGSLYCDPRQRGQLGFLLAPS